MVQAGNEASMQRQEYEARMFRNIQHPRAVRFHGAQLAAQAWVREADEQMARLIRGQDCAFA